MPGICRYPAKCTGHTVNQGGTADRVVLYQYPFALEQNPCFCQGRFFIGFNSTDRTDKTGKQYNLKSNGGKYDEQK